MSKNLHPSPMEYRVRYVINGALTESVQYYSVYHSSEALDFFAHTFRKGHIHSLSESFHIIVHAVEEYNRFSEEWEDRTDKAMEFTQAPEVEIENEGAVLLRNDKDE